jgi:hypothetical protein
VRAQCRSQGHTAGGELGSPRLGMLGRGRDASYPAPPAQIPACGTTAPGSCLGSDVQAPAGACRTRLRAWDRRPRPCGRLLVSSATFPLARSLPSPFSAGPVGRPWCAGFFGTLTRSDSLHPSSTGVPLGGTVRTWETDARLDAGPPGFRTPCCCPGRGLRPRRVHRRLALTASTVVPAACAERVGTQE